METECVDWLRKYLEKGKETLCCAQVPGAPGPPRSHLRLGLYLQLAQP